MAEVGFLLRMLEERCCQGAWEEALSLVRRLESLVGGSEEAQTAEFLLYHKGFALLELNRPEKAKPTLRRLVKLDPASAHYRLLLADAMIRTQNWDAACRHLEAGLAAEPDHPGCLCALGWAFYQKGQTRDGRATLEHVLELHPRYVPAHLDLGLIAAAEGRWEASEAYLEAAQALSPEDAEIRDILQAVRQSRTEAEEAHERPAAFEEFEDLPASHGGPRSAAAQGSPRRRGEVIWFDFVGKARLPDAPSGSSPLVTPA